MAGWAVQRSAQMLGLSLICSLLAACSGPPYERGPPSDVAPRAKSFEQTIDGDRVHWVEAGAEDGQPVLLLHGTPGSWQAWGDVLNEPAVQGLRLIAVDRAGFGESAAAGVEPSLARQADLLARRFDQRAPLIVVGHSLGGALAMRLLRDHPERVAGVVLVAASLDPAAEAPRWFNHVVQWPVFRQLVPEPLRRANIEVMALQSELRALWSGWTPDETPVILIQGMEDRLVWPQTATFVEAALPPDSLTVHRIKHAGHFVLWEQPQRVIDAILRLATQ